MNLGTELEASLKEFLAAGLVDLHENGGRASFATGLSWEVRGDGDRPLLHLWAERFNLTRRVLAITDHSEQRLVLAVERFGHGKPDRLEFVRREFERGARQVSRSFLMIPSNRLRFPRTWNIPSPGIMLAGCFAGALCDLQFLLCQRVHP